MTAPLALLIGAVVSLNASFISSEVFADPTVTPSIRVFGAVIPFATILTIAVGAIRGEKQSRYRVYVQNLFRPITRFGLVAVAIAYGASQTGLALAYSIPFVLTALLATMLVVRSVPGSFIDREIAPSTSWTYSRTRFRSCCLTQRSLSIGV